MCGIAGLWLNPDLYPRLGPFAAPDVGPAAEVCAATVWPALTVEAAPRSRDVL